MAQCLRPVILRLGQPNNYKITVYNTELIEYSGPMPMTNDFQSGNQIIIKLQCNVQGFLEYSGLMPKASDF